MGITFNGSGGGFSSSENQKLNDDVFLYFGTDEDHSIENDTSGGKNDLSFVIGEDNQFKVALSTSDFGAEYNGLDLSYTITNTAASANQLRAVRISSTHSDSNNITGAVQNLSYRTVISGGSTDFAHINNQGNTDVQGSSTLQNQYAFVSSVNVSSGSALTNRFPFFAANNDGAVAPTNSYLIGFGTDFVSNNNLRVAVGSIGSVNARWLPLSQYNDGDSQVEVTQITNSDSPYTVLSTDNVLLIDTSGGAVELDLPAAASSSNKKYIIKDKGNAATNNITIDPNGSEEIDGSSTSLVVSTNLTSVSIISDGSAWWIL